MRMPLFLSPLLIESKRTLPTQKCLMLRLTYSLSELFIMRVSSYMAGVYDMKFGDEGANHNRDVILG
jgi:hypothetical protein